jgi:hypothetical protein
MRNPWRTLAAVLWLLAAGRGLAPDARPAHPRPRFAEAPLWRLDLRTLGLVAGRRLAPLEAASAGLHPLVFVSAHRLAVAFLTYAEAPQLMRRGQPAATPLQLHLFVLDATAGRVLAHRTIAVPNLSVDVIAAPGGRFVLAEPRWLVQLSPSLAPLLTRRLPPLAGFEANERVLAAPDGATFALRMVGRDWSEDRWIRSADLSLIADRQGDRVLAVGSGPTRGRARPIIVRQIRVRARRLTAAQALAAERSACASSAPPPPLTAVTARLPVIALAAVCSGDGALIAAAPPRFDSTGLEGFLADGLLLAREFPGLALYDRSFHLIEQRRPQHDATAYGAPAVTGSGGWFALPVWTASAGMSVLDMQGFARLQRIAIVDADANRMFELKARGRTVAHLDALALAPDASKLAVLHNGLLQVFAVPATTARGWRRFDNRQAKH